MASRELAVTEDPYAYDEDEINNYNIVEGFNVSTKVIDYQIGGSSPAFRTIRVNQFSDAANREVIIEESIDQVAAASIFAGTNAVSGSFEAAFRGYDFHLSGLMKGIMGYQTPSSVSSNSAHNAGYKYSLSMVPATLALKIVDEQATDTTGSNNVQGTTVVYRGVGITNFELNLQVKDYAKATVQWIGRKGETFDVGYNTNSAISGDPNVFHNAELKWEPYSGGSYGTSETMKCKGFTMTLARTMDQDLFFIGSEFLQGLYYNGLTDLGGQITLGAGDWQRIRTMMAGATTGGSNVLDEGKREFVGTAAAGTVLANTIPAGRFTVLLHTPDGTKEVAKIVCDMAKLTEMSRSVSGRNQFEKTVTWKAQINSTDTYYMEVYSPV